MTIAITHPFVSAKGDGTDATLVRPSNWNATHSTSMATANLLGRLTAGVGAFEEIAITALIAAALNSASGAAFLTAIGAGGFFTGDIKARYGTGALTGYVRLNGNTIGSATSGAGERANADTQTLFQYLWDTDPNLVVGAGRGVSSIADWNANKSITLPDLRGRTIAGLDGMGFTLAGRLTSTYTTGTPDLLGSGAGAESQTLTLAQLPTGITGTVSVGAGGAAIPFVNPPLLNQIITAPGPGPNTNAPVSAQSWTSATSLTGTMTSNNTGGNPHPNVQPTLLMTWYIKL